MSSRRAERRRSCERKIAYADARSAWRAATAAFYHPGERMHAYRCQFCHRWHIGHQRKCDRQAAAARREG